MTTSRASALLPRAILGAIVLCGGVFSGTPAVLAQAPPRFATVPSPNPSPSNNVRLKDVDALAGDDVWAVGFYSVPGSGAFQTLAMHWNGTRWAITQTPNPIPPNDQLKKVAAISPIDVWAVGGHARSYVLRWRGSQWAQVPLPPISNRGFTDLTNSLEGIDGSSSNDVWAVGAVDALNGGTSTLTMHWDGTQWRQVASPNQTSPSGTVYSQALESVVALAANDVWAVGYYRVGNTAHPLVLRWDGSVWSIVPAPDGPTGDGWLHSVAASGPNQIVAVGEYQKTDFNTYARGFALHWNGASWTVAIPPDFFQRGVNPLLGVTARGTNDFYAVGFALNFGGGLNTYAVRWDGTSWTEVPTENMFTSSTGWRQLNGVAADANGRLWAAGSAQEEFGLSTYSLVQRAEPSGTPTPTPAPTASPSPTSTPMPTATATPTAAPTPSATPSPTPSATPTPGSSPTPSPTTPPRPINISTRLRVEPGENAMIAGFIVRGEATKRLYIRTRGPSLERSGIGDPLRDPVLRLFAADGSQIAYNDDWRDSQQAEIRNANGGPPPDDREAAIVATLPPGLYTAVVEGKEKGSGVALIEAYDQEQQGRSGLANLSTRGLVETGDDVMIAGFILGGQNYTLQMVFRGLGPSLVGAGIAKPLADPTIELRNNQGVLVASNDNWQDDPDQAARLRALGLAPSHHLEPAFAVDLPVNFSYFTAIVRGKGETIGVGVVELYHVQ